MYAATLYACASSTLATNGSALPCVQGFARPLTVSCRFVRGGAAIAMFAYIFVRLYMHGTDVVTAPPSVS